MPISNDEAVYCRTSSRRGWVGEFWAVDTVATPNHVQTLVTAFEVRDGANRLALSVMTAPKDNPPARTSRPGRGSWSNPQQDHGRHPNL